MVRRELITSFLVICFFFSIVTVASCKSSPPVILVTGDGTGDFNCKGTNDQIQINQALQFVAENNKYTTVHLKGPFTYIINDTLLIGVIQFLREIPLLL